MFYHDKKNKAYLKTALRFVVSHKQFRIPLLMITTKDKQVYHWQVNVYKIEDQAIEDKNERKR